MGVTKNLFKPCCFLVTAGFAVIVGFSLNLVALINEYSRVPVLVYVSNGCIWKLIANMQGLELWR